MIHRLAVCAALAAALVATPARLALAACTITASSVAFGGYDVFAVSHRDSVGHITYRCDGGETSVTIALDTGGAGFNPRRLASGARTADYNLYLDAARTRIWGDGSSGTQVYSASNPPSNQDVTVTVYGRLPARQDVPVGSYADTIVVTISY